jgi:hypothetical protein
VNLGYLHSQRMGFSHREVQAALGLASNGRSPAVEWPASFSVAAACIEYFLRRCRVGQSRCAGRSPNGGPHAQCVSGASDARIFFCDPQNRRRPSADRCCGWPGFLRVSRSLLIESSKIKPMDSGSTRYVPEGCGACAAAVPPPPRAVDPQQ